MNAPLKSATLFSCLVLFQSAGAAQPKSYSAEPANVMLGRHDGARFLRIEDLDFATLLPKPPAPESIEGAADLDTVLQVQASRTREEIDWAKAMEKDDVFLNHTVVGGWFDPLRLPITAAFFRALSNDLKAVDAASKIPFNRPRPYQRDPRVKACVSLPSSSSYPSGSALQALVWAELLAELLPAKREALIARAHRAAWGRVIGGVHFPTDIEAGRRLVGPFLEACRRNPEFTSRLRAVREEFSNVDQK
jgi:acid phosphatase (class A)